MDKIFWIFKCRESYSARVEKSSKNKSALIRRYLFLVLRLEGLTVLETQFHSTASGAVWAATPWASSENSRNNPLGLESAADTSSAAAGYARMQLHLSKSPSLRLPRCLIGKQSTCNAGDARGTGMIAGLGRFPGEGSGYPLQYSWLENSMDRGAWWATLHGVAKS